jgi:putative protease
MAMTFSRGFSHGFLDGNDHKKLVRGDYAKKRGLFVGEVVAIHGRTARVRTDVAIQPGDGVVFDGNERNGVPEQGGRVFEARRSNNWIELGFDSRAVDLSRVVIGQRVWKTDDPVVSRRLKATFEGPPRRRVAIEVRAVARAGERLLLTATTADGRAAEAQSEGPLAVALNRPATAKLLHEQFDRLGQTVYELRSFIAEVEGEPLVPASVLNSTRRQLVERLDALAAPPPAPTGPPQVVPRLRNAMDRSAGHSPPEPTLIAFCRNTSQALSALDAGTNIIYLEYQHIKEYGDAVRQLRNASDSVTIYLAPPRIEKPGEAPIFAFLARQGSDGLLVRNAGSLEFCVERGIRFVADFSMNAANELTVDLLRRKGAERVTASYDLSFDQLMQLAQNGSPQSLEVVLHQHMPMFHMEHCVFCAVLSPGHDKTDCGRPCDHHDVRLRDRVGMEHPLLADVGCRNTLYNAVPQSAAEYLPRLLSLGVRHFRVEFLHDDSAAVRHVLHLYREAIAGRRDTARLWKELRANNRYGVTRGQLAIVE